MTQKTTGNRRELAHRADGGIDVTLYWSERTNLVTVTVYDARVDEGFELEVDGRHALDVYYHPFAYASDEETRKKIAVNMGYTLSVSEAA
jgi:hypothetical protein